MELRQLEQVKLLKKIIILPKRQGGKKYLQKGNNFSP